MAKHHQFENCMSLIIGPLTNFGLLFPVVCFVFVSGQPLPEHQYRDKGLYDPLLTRTLCSKLSNESLTSPVSVSFEANFSLQTRNNGLKIWSS